jgi:hypothetical protein
MPRVLATLVVSFPLFPRHSGALPENGEGGDQTEELSNGVQQCPTRTGCTVMILADFSDATYRIRRGRPALDRATPALMCQLAYSSY